MLALCFNYVVVNFGLDETFKPLTGSMVVVIYIFTAALMCFARVLIRTLFENMLIGKNAKNILIYGTHAGAMAMTSEIRNVKPVKYIIRGYIGDSKPHYKERMMGKRIYSTHEDLLSVIKEQNIQAVMVSPLKQALFMKNREFQDLLINAGVKIYVAQNAESWSKHQDINEHVQMREVKIEDLLPRD